jgi:CBS domain-containing protein
VRDALALVLEKHVDVLAVTDESGAVIGSVTKEALLS